MKKEEESFERIRPLRPGDVVLRRRRPHRRLRVLPNIPAFFRFLRDVSARTPLVPLLLTLIALWLLFSLGLYLAESGVSEQISSYGSALWWTFAAMQTQGAATPVTASGRVIGLIWSIISTILFWGIILSLFYAYFTRPVRRPSREMISTIQYNLGELENLSADELEALRDTTVRLINAQVTKIKEKNIQADSTERE